MDIYNGYKGSRRIKHIGKSDLNINSPLGEVPFGICVVEDVFEKNRAENEICYQKAMCEIIWIKEGSGTLLIDMEKYAIKQDTICCIEPGQLYQFRESDDIRGYRISVSPEFLGLQGAGSPLQRRNANSHTSGFENNACLRITEEMKQIFEVIIKEYSKHLALRSDLLKGLTRILFIYLTRENPIAEKPIVANSANVLMSKFLQLLNNDLTTRRMVRDYASELAVTTNHLNQSIKKITGFTVSRYIHQFKLIEAKKRVLYFGSTMKEIAYHLGFDDIYHFSKFFKRNCGVSFQKFKKENRRFVFPDTAQAA